MARNDMTREAAEEVLELPRRYTKEDVRKAYTDLARTYHPDAIAKRHLDPEEAQRLMVEANKAYATLKPLFAEQPDRAFSRIGGISGGFADVDWHVKHGDPKEWESDDIWDFADDWGAEPPPEKVPLSLRSVLLGPIVLRILLIAAFAWLWWATFPLLGHNLGRYLPAGAWTLYDVFVLVAAMVYPSYLLVYELLSGHISNFLREVMNGGVTWLTRHYVDLRPHTASYGCALYKLLREQVYGLLMAPLVLWLASLCVQAHTIMGNVVFGIMAVAVGIDMLAAWVHGGYINTWTAALAERVEARYLLLRASLLKRCDKWGGEA